MHQSTESKSTDKESEPSQCELALTVDEEDTLSKNKLEHRPSKSEVGELSPHNGKSLLFIDWGNSPRTSKWQYQCSWNPEPLAHTVNNSTTQQLNLHYPREGMTTKEGGVEGERYLWSLGSGSKILRFWGKVHSFLWSQTTQNHFAIGEKQGDLKEKHKGAVFAMVYESPVSSQEWSLRMDPLLSQCWERDNKTPEYAWGC